MTETGINQQMLDEQGFIITWHTGPGRRVGEVVKRWATGKGPNGGLGPWPLVVIGPATFEEFRAQCQRYYHCEADPALQIFLFYKAIAE